MKEARGSCRYPDSWTAWAAVPALALLVMFSGSIARSETQATARGTKVAFEADAFPTAAAANAAPGWSTWSQREETRPHFFTAEIPSLGGAGSLGIDGASNSSAHGCWRKVVEGIIPGNYYRFEAFYQARAVPYPRQQVLSLLDWLDGEGKRVSQPEFVAEADTTGKWQKNEGLFQAPAGASKIRIELYLSYCPQGTVWWDRISLNEVASPGKRMVRAATVNCYPRGLADSRASVAAFIPLLEQAGQAKCDIVCLGEWINLVGVYGAEYQDVAEPIPGPTTETLGAQARKYGMYIVASLGEREGNAIYNAAVLIDRQGRVAGKYRKVYLPREETEAGCTPGNAYPVFDTDFGRVGMMVCWDVQYADPARALAVQGAEMIFLPVWGGNPVLTQARAIENQVYLVSSSYSEDLPTAIYDPWGKILAEAKERPSLAWCDIDLNQRHPDEWLGDMRLRFLRERRADIKVGELER